MSITRAFAILAPIPEAELIASKQVCDQQGKVAFGSRSLDLFRKLDRARGKDDINVFICLVTPQEIEETTVSWQGVYIRQVQPYHDGGHPAGLRFRPAIASEMDVPGYWAVFWEVQDLQPIAPIPISTLLPFDRKTHYSPNFIPDTPLLINTRVNLPAPL